MEEKMHIENALVHVENHSYQMPSWTTALINAGFLVAQGRSPERRTLLVLLLPTRELCSSFCALGSLAHALTNDVGSVKWGDLVQLSNGSKIYFMHIGQALEGTVEDIGNMDGRPCRKIKIVSDKKRFSGGSIWIFPEQISKYHLSLSPYAGTRRQIQTLSKVASFYDGVVDGFTDAAMDLTTVEIVIVSNKSKWWRQNAEVAVSMRDGPIGLPELLMVGGLSGKGTPRTLLQTPRCSAQGLAPIVILDGKDSMRSLEFFPHSDAIILLSHSEYDQEASDYLAMLAGYRDYKPELFENDPALSVPPGSEAVFMTFGK